MAKKEDAALRASRGRSDKALGYRLKRLRSETMKPTSAPADQSSAQQDKHVSLELGWGRLLFAQTFETNEELAGALRDEGPARRDIAGFAARVLDLESYLRDAQRTRLERILQTLEADTGYKLRVATQSRATAPGLKSLRAQWAADDRTVIVIADAGIPGALEAGNPFLRFDVGDEASFVMPPIFFSRLTREFGKAPFVSDPSKYGASIVASCEIILTCLRQEEFCVDVPAARTYPLFE